MTSLTVYRIALAALGGGAIALGMSGAVANVAIVASQRPRAPSHKPTGSGTLAARIAMDSLMRRAVAAAPFRARRTASKVAYDPDRASVAAAPPAPKPPKPTLALSGVVWGRVPVAVVEGIPGVDGARTLRRGETVGGLTVKQIDRSRVVIRGLDTTWTLTVRIPW